MSNMDQMADEELFLLVQQGSKEAFAKIYDRYWGVLYMHAHKMLDNNEAAKDLLQDLFVSIWENAADIQLKQKLSSYLYAAVKHRVLNKWAHDEVRLKYFSTQKTIQATSNNLIQDLLYEKQLAEKIEQELNQLPTKMREVFELSRKQNLSHRDIGAVLNISEKTVKKQVNNAIKLLKIKLLSFFI